MFENLTIENKDHVSYITINRPSQLNALNKKTIEELNQALRDCEDNPNTGVVVITGSGDKAFVAGADIKEFADFSIAEGGMLASEGQKILFDFVENFPKPIIAAINGFALGGLELL